MRQLIGGPNADARHWIAICLLGISIANALATSIMRRADEESAEAHTTRHLEPDGDVHVERHPPASFISAEDTHHHEEEQRVTARDQHPYINKCNEDYTAAGADVSTSGTGQHYGCGNLALIDSADECQSAALSSGAAINRQAFKLAPVNQSAHPPGCFQWPCKAPNGMVRICFFYNPVDAANTGGATTGVPMCERRFYMDGVPDTYGGNFAGNNANGKPNSGCAEPYEVIMDETACLAADGCFGLKLGEPNVVGRGVGVAANLTMTKTAPVGCLIKKNFTQGTDGTDRDRVQFNRLEPGINDDITMTDFQPVGVPICKIKAIYHTPVGNGAFNQAATQPTQTVASEVVGDLEAWFGVR